MMENAAKGCYFHEDFPRNVIEKKQENDRSSRLHVLFKMVVLKSFTILTGKHLC